MPHKEDKKTYSSATGLERSRKKYSARVTKKSDSRPSIVSSRSIPIMMVFTWAAVAQRITAVLKKIEYGLYKEDILVLPKMIFYLLQDGCKFQLP